MSAVSQGQVQVFEMHGARFESFVRPSTGSEQLCAWRVRLAAGLGGAAHRVSHEEVLLVLAGRPTATVDGHSTALASNDVVFVPAGAELQLDNHDEAEAEIWVTTSVGLEASLGDGTLLRPPWAQ